MAREMAICARSDAHRKVRYRMLEEMLFSKQSGLVPCGIIHHKGMLKQQRSVGFSQI